MTPEIHWTRFESLVSPGVPDLHGIFPTEWEYSTRKDFLEVFGKWLLEEDEETDDELSFSTTPSQLVLKIKSVIDDGELKMTFTKEHGEQEGETDETV